MSKPIVFVDQNLGGGGAERVLCTIIRELDQKIFDIHLVLIGRLDVLSHLIPHYVTVHELGINKTSKAFYPFIRKMREITPKIVFTSLERITLLLIFSRPFCRPYRLIARYPTMPSRQIETGFSYNWRFLLTKYFYRFTDIAIAQTNEMAIELHEIFAIKKEKIHTISNPIDVRGINRALFDKPSPFNKNHINIVASGRLVFLKGFDILIESIAELVSLHPNLHLHILGQDVGNLKLELKNQARVLGCDNHVHFHGYLQNPYPFYKYCDVFVLSSRYEGMPNVVLECLHLGVPIVATRCVPILDRLIKNKRNGFIVDIEDPHSLAIGIQKSLSLNIHKLGSMRSDVNQFIDLFFMS